MKNYYIFKMNTLNEYAKTLWDAVKDDYTTENILVRRSYAASDTFWQIQLDPLQASVDAMRLKFKKITNENCLVEFYLGSPKTYMSRPHVDRGRRVGLNIPIQVDLDNSATYFGKYNDLTMYDNSRVKREFSSTLTDSKGKLFEAINPEFKGIFVEDLYDIVRLENPVVFNAGKPHGGFNKSTNLRVIMSLSWTNTTFEEFINSSINLGYIDNE